MISDCLACLVCRPRLRFEGASLRFLAPVNAAAATSPCEGTCKPVPLFSVRGGEGAGGGDTAAVFGQLRIDPLSGEWSDSGCDGATSAPLLKSMPVTVCA